MVQQKLGTMRLCERPPQKSRALLPNFSSIERESVCTSRKLLSAFPEPESLKMVKKDRVCPSTQAKCRHLAREASEREGCLAIPSTGRTGARSWGHSTCSCCLQVSGPQSPKDTATELCTEERGCVEAVPPHLTPVVPGGLSQV